MYYKTLSIILIFILTSCYTTKVINQDLSSIKNQKLQDCIKNISLIKQLSKSINKYHTYSLAEVDSLGGINFFIYDLLDKKNHQANTFDDKSFIQCVEFIDNHFYHFASIHFSESYSNIAHYSKGKFTIFEAINCKKLGDSLKDVIEYIENNIAAASIRNNLLKNLNQYRKYGKYTAFDNYDMVLSCDCDPCD